MAGAGSIPMVRTVDSGDLMVVTGEGVGFMEAPDFIHQEVDLFRLRHLQDRLRRCSGESNRSVNCPRRDMVS